MTRYFRRVGVLLLSFLLAFGGGGIGAQAQTAKPWFPDGASGIRSGIDVLGGNRSPRWLVPGGGPVTPTVPPEINFGGRIEETDTSAVTFAGPWTTADARLGWSGGSALQSATAGATVSFTFTGTSVRWLGSRGRNMGIAAVSLDGVLVKEVDLFHRPTDSAHMPIVTLHDLSDGRHTLTITVTGRHNTQSASANIVVDAFEVQPATTVSRWQDSNPGINYAGGWIQSANDGMWRSEER